MKAKQNLNFKIGETVVYPKHGVGQITEFKKINIESSIDGIEEHNDYLRNGSKWNIVSSNIKKLKNLEKGITIKGIKYESIKVNIIEKNKNNAWIKMRLMEGKNREIRKIISFFGWTINKLKRISYGPIQLKKLKKNEIEEININKYFKKKL